MAPTVYVLALLPTVFFSVVTMATMERTVGLHTLWYMGDIDLLISLGIYGSVFFGGASFGLIRAERLHSPSLRDHFRYTAFLYAIALGSGIFVLPLLLTGQALGLAEAYQLLLLGASLIGIAINGLLFLLLRKPPPLCKG